MLKHACLLLTIVAFTQEAFGQLTPLVFNFDSASSVYIDSAIIGNVWQIGPPQKAIFDSARSVPNVMVTDTIGFYPVLNQSEFVIKSATYTGWMGGVRMTFWHKYDTDSLLDGGTILVSYDDSIWQNLIYTTPDFSGYNSDTTEVFSLAQMGFSGNSSGWEQSTCYWNYPPSDTLYVKFIFASDGIQTSREGWLIDDLRFEYDLGYGISEQDFQGRFKLFPNPMTNHGWVDINNINKQSFKMEIFDSSGRLVRSESNITESIEIDSQKLESGVYVLRLLDNEQIEFSGKLVVN